MQPTPRSARRRLALPLLFVAALIGCGGSSDQTVDLVNNAKEQGIGRSLNGRYELIYPIIDANDPVAVWATELMLPLDASSRSYRNADEFDGFKLRLINDTSVARVFAIPAGYVFMTTGTLLNVETCGEVAAVLAHEMIHVTQRHGIDELVEARGLLGTAELFKGDRLLTDAEPAIFETFEAIEYDRVQATEADDFSLQVTFNAGYNPHTLTDVLERLVEDGDAAALQPLITPAIGASERLTLVKSTIASRYTIRVERDVTQSYDCLGTSMPFEEVKALIEAGTVTIQAGTGTGGAEE